MNYLPFLFHSGTTSGPSGAEAVSTEPDSTLLHNNGGRSEWWEFFSLKEIKDEEGKVVELLRQCKHCRTAYKHSGGTGNMANHVKLEHLTLYLEWKQKRQIKLIKNTSNQLILESTKVFWAYNL